MMRGRRGGEEKRKGLKGLGLGDVTTDVIHVHFKKYKNQ